MTNPSVVVVVVVAVVTLLATHTHATRMHVNAVEEHVDGDAHTRATPLQLSSTPVLVPTPLGPVLGNATSSFRTFLGIPYARPPVGSLRWQPPQPADAWGPTPLDARAFRPACPQHCELPPHTCPHEENEDCLYLNIYTPPDATPTSALPTMVWIHGGDFRQGSADGLLYNGTYAARRHNVVVVDIEYRLGALGFFLNNAAGATGNYALRDQRLALEWVRDNVAAFGGSPTNVTVFGQSAGGTSIAVHLTSPRAPAFSRAIVESDPSGLRVKSATEMKALSRDFAKALGCAFDDQSCLLAATPASIVTAARAVQNKDFPLLHPLDLFMPWVPTIDGDLVAEQPLTAFTEQRFHRMPIVWGTVADEAYLFIYSALTKPLARSLFRTVLELLDPFAVARLEAHYACGDAEDCRPQLARLGTDLLFRCPARAIVRAVASNVTNPPIFPYLYDHVSAFDFWGPHYAFCASRVCHGSELPWVFHVDRPLFTFTPDEARLSQSMVRYWTAFAVAGDPNAGAPPGAAVWKAYDRALDNSMLLATPACSQIDNVDADSCDLWDSIGYLKH